MNITAISYFGRNEPGAKEPIVHPSAIIGWDSLLDCQDQITIEEDVFFGHRVMILTGYHDINTFGVERKLAAIKHRPVVIKAGAWIASGAIICPGVTIGEHAVVSAGSVVLTDVEPLTLVRGNPAILIRRLNASTL